MGKMTRTVTGRYVVRRGVLNFFCPWCGQTKTISFTRGFGRIGFVPCTCGRKFPDSRREPRKKICLSASIDEGKKGGVVINNISMGGARIFVNRSSSILCVGDEVTITIFRKNKKEIKVKSIVRNISSDWSVGIEFTVFGRNSQKIIRSILDYQSR